MNENKDNPIIKKYKVSLKKLHKRFPNNQYFKPTLRNKIFFKYAVKTENENYYLEQKIRIPTLILIFPFLVVFNIVWKGLSSIPEIIKTTPLWGVPTRIDRMLYEDYKELIK